MRFLWVGAEEEGLLGSNYYVSQLTDAQKLKIIAMLDFDMVASPNYARQVYDGDGSTFAAPSARAMTICWTSSVPSPMVRILASR